MNRTDYLEYFRSLLSLIRFQVQLPAREIDADFYFRCVERLSKSLRMAQDLGHITGAEYREIYAIRDQLHDHYEVACREIYESVTAPLFFTQLFREAEKDAQGYPFPQVRLLDLLEQDVFKELPAIGHATSGTTSNILSLAG